MTDVLERFRSKAREWTREALKRRRITTSDAGADVLDYVAGELEIEIDLAERESLWLTPSEFAEQSDVTPQTVRGWIRAGRLDADRTARGYRIKRGTKLRNRARRQSA